MAFVRLTFTTAMLVVISSPAALALPDGAFPGFDGSPASGFTSCTFCHTGPTHNDGGVVVLGAPARYIPGRTYDLSVRVFDPAQFGAGFELSVETPAGVHVGQLVLSDAVNTQFASGDPHFVTHTLAGHIQSETDWVSNGNSYDFTLQWLAPTSDVGPIGFYAAGNADDDNNAPTGDSIYTTSTPSQFNSCLADLTGDGTVNGTDLATMLTVWGSADPDADLTGDGVVDGADLATLLAGWGPCP